MYIRCINFEAQNYGTRRQFSYRKLKLKVELITLKLSQAEITIL